MNTMRYRALLKVAAAMGLFGSALSASASEVTYNLLTGEPSQIVVTATYGSSNQPVYFNGSLDWTITLSSGSLTMDASGPTLDSFSFVDASAGPASVSLSSTGSPAVASLSMSNITVASTASSGLTGSNPYSFNTTNTSDSAGYSYTLTGSSTAHPGTVSTTGQALVGTITTGTNGSLDLSQTQAIQLGSFMLNGQMVTLKGDITFDGAAPVPLPAAVWLLGPALGVFGFGLRRRVGG
jgi:uncharacterized Zn-binding protein involved in type VI secretion